MNALVYRVNSGLSFLLGFALNIFLIWLIFKKTVKEMKSYSKILLQTVVIDLIYLTVSSTVIPVIYVKSGATAILQYGLFSHSDNSGNLNMFFMYITVIVFSQWALPVQFIHRYLIVCRYFGMLSVSIFLTLLFTFCIVYTTYVNMSLVAVLQFYFLFMVILTYFIIIFTSIMIFLKMKRSLNMLTSKRSREFNIQISVALVVQAFMPIIFALFPSGLLASASVGKSEIAELLSLSSSFLLSWSPVINPFATIMIVKPYRLVFCMSQNKTEVSLTKVISRVSPRTTNRPLVVTHSKPVINQEFYTQ